MTATGEETKTKQKKKQQTNPKHSAEIRGNGSVLIPSGVKIQNSI